jgi:hypothetical protein
VGISLKDIKVDGEIPGQKFSPFLMVMERDFRGRVAYYAQLSDEVASLSSAWPPCPIMSSFQEFPQALRAEFPVVGH